MELNEVCDLIIDCEHKTAPTQETGYPSIRTPNIGRGRFILEGVNRVSEETYQLWTRRAVPQPSDLIMAREAPVGNVAMIPPGLQPCLGQRTLLIRPDRSKVEPAFLNYFLNGPHVQGLIHAKTNGATVAHLNMKDVRTMELPELPPLPVQRRIAGILSAYDELMENSQRRIRLLEAMARALYREWFVHFRIPAEVLTKAGAPPIKPVASPLGHIPQGWEVRTVKDVATVTYGFPFASKKFNTDGIGTPVIRIRDILDGSINTFTDEEAEPKYHIKNGDILVGMDGDFHICIWSSGHAFQNQRVAKFESNGEIGNYHLFLALELPIQTWNKSIVGTTVAHLGDMHIKTIQIAWPPAKILAKVREILEPMSEQIIALKRQIQNLRRTRDLLLPRLLSGQVELKTEAA
jgi:type I restriction enzyme S subunit